MGMARFTTTITTSHPTSWAPKHRGLQDIAIPHEVRNVRGFTGRYNVVVNGERVGWATSGSEGWSACQAPWDREYQGKLVAKGYRTRTEAVEELLTTLAQVRGPVQDIVVAAWQPAEVQA